MTSREVLELLNEIDNGYKPTEDEKNELSIIKLIIWHGIEKIPESICNLNSLQSLYLNFARLSELPESICNLNSLQSLILSSTHLSELPESIVDLNNLQSLNLNFTRLSELPESIVDLNSLQSLKLKSTQLSELPESIGHLNSLQRLDLSHTQLSDLPESIGNLTSLYVLVLEDITLVELPEELLSLKTEYKNERDSLLLEKPGIYIHGLKLQKQPVSLFYQPRELIQKYYDSEKVELKESKVIFMGDGGAGKSYTIQRIMNNGRLLKNDTDVTHDISIEHWDNSERFVDYDGTIDFWDFGGQDIYLSMHRCFLTDRCCYVIVLCNRQYGSYRGLMRQARYWLKNISPFANDSPILIAINTWSGQPKDGLSLTQLKSEFANLNIVDQIVYDAHDSACEEFNRLTSKICKIAQKNYSYGLKFPVSWNNIKTRVLNEYSEENFISESEYFRICKKEMTEHDGYYEEEIARWLLNWFNDLGYCFNYHGIDEKTDGEEYQVLKPQWVIRAMYKIINYKISRHSDAVMPQTEMLSEGLAKSKRFSEGRVSKTEIIDLLTEGQKDGGSYTEDEAEYIIRILRKFKLAYLLVDQESEELFIPALCSDLRPELFDEIDASQKQKISYLVRFKYLPETVIQHLMIKCYQNGRRLQKVWKNGFHIKAKQGRIIVEMLNDTEIKMTYYESDKDYDCYGLHEMRTWLAEVYQEIGIENSRDFIIVQEKSLDSYISVKALVNAYIENPTIEVFYTQDNDIYKGHSVDTLLRGLYGSNYKEIIDKEVERLKEADSKKEDVAPEVLSKQFTYTYIAEIIEGRFRTQFTDPPEKEKYVQEQLRKFLDAQGYRKGIDYERESGRVMFAGREYVPDFVLKHSNSVIEVKFLKDKGHKSKMIEEMNTDYSAYTKEYDSIIYLIYDLGIISDVQEIKRDFEAKGNVKVIVIKH